MSLALEFDGGSGKAFAIPEGGPRPGRLMTIVDLGVQKQEPYQGQIKKPSQQVILGFDLVDDLDEEGVPIRITTGLFPLNVTIDYKTRSLNEKSKLAKIVKALDPSGTKFKGDLRNLLGEACVVNVKLTSKTSASGDTRTYANFDGAGPVPNMKGFTVAESSSPQYVFDFDNPTLEAWKTLNDKLKVRVREAVNYPGSAAQVLDETFMTQEDSSGPVAKDDVPF